MHCAESAFGVVGRGSREQTSEDCSPLDPILERVPQNWEAGCQGGDFGLQDRNWAVQLGSWRGSCVRVLFTKPRIGDCTRVPPFFFCKAHDGRFLSTISHAGRVVLTQAPVARTVAWAHDTNTNTLP